MARSTRSSSCPTRTCSSCDAIRRSHTGRWGWPTSQTYRSSATPQCRGLARVEAQLRARGVEPEFAFRSDMNATIQALVGAGVGAAVLPALAVDETDKLTTTRELPGIPPRVLAVVRHRDRVHAPAAKSFVDAAVAVCASLRQPRLAAVKAVQLQ